MSRRATQSGLWRGRTRLGAAVSRTPVRGLRRRWAAAGLIVAVLAVASTGLTALTATAASADTSYSVTTTIPVGSTPTGVAVDSTTHKAYVANKSSGTVSVIADADDTATATTTVAGD